MRKGKRWRGELGPQGSHMTDPEHAGDKRRGSEAAQSLAILGWRCDLQSVGCANDGRPSAIAPRAPTFCDWQLASKRLTRDVVLHLR